MIAVLHPSTHEERKQACFFRAKALGEHKIRKAIQKSCAENDIVGLGDKGGIVTNSLCGIVETLLIVSGREYSSVMDRTGNMRAATLLNYQKISGREGRMQNRII